MPVRVSVVIPVLNEAALIGLTLERARASGADEVIVVDGGSTDGTAAAAAAADLVITAPRGRGLQLNAGAARARGDVFLFLHADCWLEPGAADSIREAVEGGCVAGCFRQRIEAAGVPYRLLEAGNALRVRSLGWVYGDQALFVRRETFAAAGGFPDLPLMEDLFFAKRLRRVGRVCLLPQRVHVDARRWREAGVVRQTMRNWRLIALAHLGVPVSRLAGTYPDVR